MTLCGIGVSAVRCGARSGRQPAADILGQLRRGGLEDREIELSEQTGHGLCQIEVEPRSVRCPAIR